MNRAGQQIDEVYEESKMELTNWKQKLNPVEYAMECAIIKVYGSEVESFIVDEALQIHGGMGFSGESEISVHYRNVRGNRIMKAPMK